MPTAEYDLRYLKAGVEQLEEYLLSNEIYRPIGIYAPFGEPPYPQMTLGGLLLARLRAQATIQTASQSSELARLSLELESTRTKWRVAWEKKAVAEFRARLNLWRDFLEEYGEDPEANYDRYGYEVGRRVMLQLLSGEVAEVPEVEQEAVSGLDLVLKADFVPGEFIWEAVIEPSFPKKPFWYLHGDLKQRKE
jgi:hypothetical protein